MKKFFWIILISYGFIFSCGNSGNNSTPTSSGEKKEEHKHGGDPHEGVEYELGKQKLGEVEISVHQVGEVKADKEAIFGIEFPGKNKNLLKTVRGWVGVESADGSVKAIASSDDIELHVHVEVPKVLSAQSKLWLEAEFTNGSPKQKVSFAMKR